MEKPALTATLPAKCTDAERDANGCLGDENGTDSNIFIGQGFQLGNMCIALLD